MVHCRNQQKREIQDEPLQHHIASIPSSYQYDHLPKQDKLKSRDESTERKSLSEKFGSLFKRQPHMLDMPVSEPYLGEYRETRIRRDVDDLPLHQHIAIIPESYHYNTLPSVETSKKEEIEPEHGKSFTEENQRLVW